MHELSIVLNIIQIAEKESAKNNTAVVDEKVPETGQLSSNKIPAFKFSGHPAIHTTLPEKKTRTFNNIPGEIPGYKLKH